MSKLVEQNLPCPNCTSSDAYAKYDDGHGYCFSCKTPTNLHVRDEDCSYEPFPHRGLDKETLQFYNITVKISPEGEPLEVGFPYGKGKTGEDKWKIRSFFEKKFWSKGPMSEPGLFGKDKFPAGCAKAITITEGEYDAPSVYQIMGKKYPAVSVKTSTTAKKDCAAEYDYINSFERIYLCFDPDEPGQQALKEVASLFDFNKVYVLPKGECKDPNEYLQKGMADVFKQVWYNARRYLPDNIASSFTDFNEILKNSGLKESVPYPFETVQMMTEGLRTGETVLLTAPEGIGKTEIIGAIEYNLLKKTDANIGVIHLEEKASRTLQRFAGLELDTHVHKKDSMASPEEVEKALQKALGRDDRLHVYSHFGSDDPDVILSTIRFLVTACDCKYIFLDHISIVVSGLELDDERKKLDYISTKLAMMVKELDFGLVMISHENDDGKTRGSRNISKVSDIWIALSRDIENPDEVKRNTTNLMIRKNRPASFTGPAGALYFDHNKYTLTERKTELPV